PYPEADKALTDASAVADIEWLQQFLLGVRRIRAEMNIAPGKPLPVLVQHGSNGDHGRLEKQRRALLTLGRLESISWLDDGGSAPEAATALVGGMKVLIPLGGLIDKNAEIARLNKEIAKHRQEGERLSGKLANPNFIGRAPAEIVEKERVRLLELQTVIANLEAQLARIRQL
ncbi:MAG TPA: valine--tRNA ligase, partial [Candidatus Competibacteraceae bacterium]|nr:valine--tRNA ligase [Candidatus Competibacteraceae bacterium]